MIFMKINDFHQNDDFHRKINDFHRKMIFIEKLMIRLKAASEIVHSHNFRHLSRKMWKMLQLKRGMRGGRIAVPPTPAGVGAKGIHHAEGGRGGRNVPPPARNRHYAYVRGARGGAMFPPARIHPTDRGKKINKRNKTS